MGASPFRYQDLSVGKLAQIALDVLEDESDAAWAQVFATLAQVKATESMKEKLSSRLENLE
ncbi:hypothetical protein [Nocardiopsis sp. LOL_012]|uniref:hypothetical protein n=1 Tax=Nocardiopsis sp. LOL_012 TaxID=3345409 RepID=UPI003A87A8A6